MRFDSKNNKFYIKSLIQICSDFNAITFSIDHVRFVIHKPIGSILRINNLLLYSLLTSWVELSGYEYTTNPDLVCVV